MTERDARDLVDWLDQAEEETKATIAEHERIDPFYDGVLSTVQTVREYIKKMRKVDEAEGEKQMKEIITDILKMQSESLRGWIHPTVKKTSKQRKWRLKH